MLDVGGSFPSALTSVSSTAALRAKRELRNLASQWADHAFVAAKMIPLQGLSFGIPRPTTSHLEPLDQKHGKARAKRCR